MKQFFLAAFVILLTHISNAQTGRYFGVVYSYDRTLLHNEDDVNADKRLDLSPTYGSRAGFEIGYIRKHRSGVSIQFLYTNEGQKYTGETPGMTAITKLNYLKIPLYFQYYTNDSKRINIMLGLGMYYAFLKSYKDEVNMNNSNGSLNYKLTTSNFSYSYSTATPDYTLDATLEQFPYKRHIVGLNGRAGVVCRLSKHLQLTINAMADYSLHDVEYKRAIAFKPDPDQTIIGPYQPYKYYAFKYHNGSTDTRANTHAINYGVEIGLRLFGF